MSTKLKTKDGSKLPSVNLQDARFAVVAAEWNSHITDALLDGALKKFCEAGVAADMMDVFRVPGTVELTYAAAQLIKLGGYVGIVVLGCVIRGDTAHFDYVCSSVTSGITRLNAAAKTPVIFGVLTTDNEQQALDRAGGCLGNKGEEAAECAIKMYDFTLKSIKKTSERFSSYEKNS